MSNILGLWDDDNLKRIELEQSLLQEQSYSRVKTQQRLDHEAGFNAGGPVDSSASWQYQSGQIAREESEDQPFDYATEAHLHEKLYIVDEHIPWYKKIF